MSALKAQHPPELQPVSDGLNAQTMSAAVAEEVTALLQQALTHAVRDVNLIVLQHVERFVNGQLASLASGAISESCQLTMPPAAPFNGMSSTLTTAQLQISVDETNERVGALPSSPSISDIPSPTGTAIGKCTRSCTNITNISVEASPSASIISKLAVPVVFPRAQTYHMPNKTASPTAGKSNSRRISLTSVFSGASMQLPRTTWPGSPPPKPFFELADDLNAALLSTCDLRSVSSGPSLIMGDRFQQTPSKSSARSACLTEKQSNRSRMSSQAAMWLPGSCPSLRSAVNSDVPSLLSVVCSDGSETECSRRPVDWAATTIQRWWRVSHSAGWQPDVPGLACVQDRHNFHLLRTGGCRSLQEVEDEGIEIVPLWLKVCAIVPWSCGRSASKCYRFFVLGVLILSCTFAIVDAVFALAVDCGSGCVRLHKLCDCALAISCIFGFLTLNGLRRNNGEILGTKGSLLARYARSKRFEQAWKAQSWRFCIFAMILWLGVSLLRSTSVLQFYQSQVQVEDGSRSEHVVVVVFAVLSGFFISMVVCLLHVTNALVLMVDQFGSQFVQAPDASSHAVSDWNILQAVMRRACVVMSPCFLIVNTTALVMLILSAWDVTEMARLSSLLFPTTFLCIFAGCLLFRAAEVTARCEQIPSFVVTCGCSPSHRHLAEFMERSSAGFYVCQTKLTFAIALKLAYVLGLASLTIITRLAASN